MLREKRAAGALPVPLGMMGKNLFRLSGRRAVVSSQSFPMAKILPGFQGGGGLLLQGAGDRNPPRGGKNAR